MTDPTTHPEDELDTELAARRGDVADPPQGERIENIGGRIDERRPMSVGELADRAERSEVEAAIDQLGPTRQDDKPIITVFLPMAVNEVGSLLLAIGDAFPDCKASFDTDCLHIYR